MSIGPTGHVGASAAGAPLSQTKSSENVRATEEAAGPQQSVEHGKDVDGAAGIGRLAEDQRSSDRDPDGRRLWEREQQRRDETDSRETATQDRGSENGDRTSNLTADDTNEGDAEPYQVKEVPGQSGNRLDLTG